MDLFSSQDLRAHNILPEDGEVYYYGKVISPTKSDDFFQDFYKNAAWKNDEAVVYGKHYTTKRKVAWYADKAFEYTYSQITKKALLWTPKLLELKDIIEKETNETYNSCLMNLYHNGSEGMSWHSDGEKDLKENGAIASVSFGAERFFSFKHKRIKKIIKLELAHGSLLVMTGLTQKYWLHRLAPTKKVNEPRINLTFRTIVK